MNNILNAQEAFAALCLGKTVLCRHILGEFDSLDQFPATIWVIPEHEFCIKIETIELAGITFTKPLTMDEVQGGQDIFVMQSHGVVYHQKFNREVDGMIESVMGGFAQRDSENAKLQYNAFCKAVGFPTCDIAVIEIGLPKKRGNKSKSTKPIEVDQPANEETSFDDIIGPVSTQNPTSIDVEKKTSTDLSSDDVALNQLLKVDSIELLEKMEASFEKSKANISDEKVQTYTRIFEQKRKELTPDPELSVLCDAFVDEINAAVSSEELKAIRTRINSNGDLTEVESAELATRINLKSASFEKDQTSVPFENIAAAAVAQAKKVDQETQEREWTRFHNDKPYLDLGNKSQYEIEYADLSAVVIHAQSSDEANSVVEKTHHWTTDQRTPLLSLISKRLCELQEQSKVQPKEPPSLMVQIQNAPDLTTLDALEIDVSARHPDIQPRLMGYVKKRRFELEQLENAANDGGHAS
ncbi:hypothetical protein [Acinetobacter modestus]|uniref:hypothetical protein n=1 Tax=Acinetobacter modestus TaxID=1776740 RepID=UPI001F4A4535|nr:hypothetical protein [Acinetobacter modestus]MCH7328090.1 hypothetical protein [Acinetobacter modestus]